jgi:hypothetical protein
MCSNENMARHGDAIATPGEPETVGHPANHESGHRDREPSHAFVLVAGAASTVCPDTDQE